MQKYVYINDYSPIFILIYSLLYYIWFLLLIFKIFLILKKKEKDFCLKKLLNRSKILK